MWGSALPCPHRLPSCFPPPPLPDPDRASQTLCSQGWELPGGGSPGKRSPCATRKERDSRLTPHPQPFPAESSSPHRPFLRVLKLPFRPGLPQLPSSPLAGLHRLLTLLPSHFSATSEVSRKRVEEADVRGRRNYVASRARRIPGEPFRPPTPGTRRRGRGFPAPPQGEGTAPAGRPPGRRPHRVAGSPWAHNPARPSAGARAQRCAASQSAPEPHDWREGDPVVHALGRQIASELPLLPLPTLSGATRVASPPRATPRAPAIVSSGVQLQLRSANFLLGPRRRKVKRGDRDAGEQEPGRESERRGRRTWLGGPGVNGLPESRD